MIVLTITKWLDKEADPDGTYQTTLGFSEEYAEMMQIAVTEFSRYPMVKTVTMNAQPPYLSDPTNSEHPTGD